MHKAVRIVQLEPMHVASARAFGPNAQEEAGLKLFAWARRKGLIDGQSLAKIQNLLFGFDLDPSPAVPERGYEFWLAVGSGIKPEGEIEIKQFGGGLYAVARCVVDDNPWKEIPATWQRLIGWCRQSLYRMACHQWLEQPVDCSHWPTAFTVDLYLPIAHRRGAEVERWPARSDSRAGQVHPAAA